MIQEKCRQLTVIFGHHFVRNNIQSIDRAVPIAAAYQKHLIAITDFRQNITVLSVLLAVSGSNQQLPIYYVRKRYSVYTVYLSTVLARVLLVQNLPTLEFPKDCSAVALKRKLHYTKLFSLNMNLPRIKPSEILSPYPIFLLLPY